MSSHDDEFKPCPNCLTGFRLNGDPKGTVQTFGGLECYVAKGNSRDGGKKAVVLGTDVLGLAITNPKILADALAEKTGWDCHVPDYFEDGAQAILFTLASILYGFVWKVGPSWFARHKTGHVAGLAEKFCKALKNERGYERLGWVGYCCGGGRSSAENFEAVRKPFALICAEEEFEFGSLKPKAISILNNKIEKEQGIPVAILDDHASTTHGFGSRPDLSQPAVKASFEKALKEPTDWWQQHL
ncbi:hypothetical protein JCM11641_008152 [Rhodosporidiobolus odoratus]